MSVAVVTGAARGMGRECVDAVRSLAGVDVVLAVDLVAPAIDGVIGTACDVSSPAAVEALARTTVEHGPLRALVHAAGISPTMAGARRVFEVDLVGTQLLLDAFEAVVAPGSAAVCFASSAAHQIAPFVTPEQDALLDDPLAPDFLERAVQVAAGNSGFAYALAKRGVIRAAGRAAVRWGRRGARVNSLSPGLIDTPQGQQEMQHQPIMADMLEATPLGRLGESKEVAAAAAFLASDAASFVSGIDLLVDGGMVQGMAAAGEPPRP
jgi:NAD(P)-dependent dehydrogenase (short-subunit alcohol dehydrogenase family)